jgi:hypothetical protein
MKTRIFTMILVVLFAVATIAEANNNGSKDLFIVSHYDNTSGLKVQEMASDNVPSELSILNEWITSRENWEQESQEMVNDNALEESSMLNDWIASRENWEQKGQETLSDNSLENTSMLAEWITSRENWEQK